MLYSWQILSFTLTIYAAVSLSDSIAAWLFTYERKARQ